MWEHLLADVLDVPRWRGRFRQPEDYPDPSDYIEKRGYDGDGGVIGIVGGSNGGGRFSSRRVSLQSTGRWVTPLPSRNNIYPYPSDLALVTGM